MPLLTLLIGLALGATLGWMIAGRRRPGRAAPPPALEHCGLGAVLVKDRQVQWLNARMAEIMGVGAETMVGAGTRVFHTDEASYVRFAEDAQAAFDRGEAFRGEVHMRRIDGSPFWAYLAGSHYVPGRPEEGVLWLVEDVTERVEARIDLAEALALNQKLIAVSPTGIMLYRAADGACVLANEAAARIVKATREDLLKQNFRRVPTWKPAGLRDAADRALSSGVEQHLETRFISSFGSDVCVEAHFVPFQSRGERILLFLADDVSDRVKATAALRASEEKHRAVVEALNEGLALVDAEGRLSFCNTRLAEMGGYQLAEMLGRHYAEFVQESDLAQLQAKQLLGSQAGSEALEVGLRRRDGSIMEAWVSLASVADEKGAFSSLAILVTDISIRKRAQRQSERLVRELEQKNKELETLLYVASHDLRSPLVNIQGFSQRLAKSLDEIRRLQGEAGSVDALRTAIAPHLQERMPASLEFIRASGARMDGIINGLLTLSRAGRMVLRTETLDMNAILKACSATLAFQFQSAGGQLLVEDLPPCRADGAQVAQIVSNLLDNAIKYRDHERPLRVQVRGRAGSDACVYEVEDNGVGIAPEHRERIWEIFQRLDPHGPIPGDGLGLTLVRRMVERNGGRILVDSAPEQGCLFRIELPAPAG